MYTLACRYTRTESTSSDSWMSTSIIYGKPQLLWMAIDFVHVAVTYGILPIDDDLTSSNSETEQDEVDT